MSYARCKCFLDSNIYIKQLGHLIYRNGRQFAETYGSTLSDGGTTDLGPILNEVREEVQRRRNLPNESIQRAKFIRANYKPLHPDIFIMKEDYLHPDFLQLTRKSSSPDTTAEMLTKGSPEVIMTHEDEVYSFPLFTEAFCAKFLAELDHFNQSTMPKGRPNSMNNYGVLLDELGFNEGFLIPLRDKYLEPLSRLLFPSESAGGFDTHKAFTVEYQEDKDVDLDVHFDNAEVTLNVCLLLSADCEGGELYFGAPDSNRGFGYVHQPGRAVLHRGSEYHCVLPLTSGRRVNMVMWMRSSSVRNQRCPMCGKPPELEPVQDGWGDGFTTS